MLQTAEPHRPGLYVFFFYFYSASHSTTLFEHQEYSKSPITIWMSYNLTQFWCYWGVNIRPILSHRFRAQSHETALSPASDTNSNSRCKGPAGHGPDVSMTPSSGSITGWSDSQNSGKEFNYCLQVYSKELQPRKEQTEERRTSRKCGKEHRASTPPADPLPSQDLQVSSPRSCVTHHIGFSWRLSYTDTNMKPLLIGEYFYLQFLFPIPRQEEGLKGPILWSLSWFLWKQASS